MMEFSREETEFMRYAEIALLRCLAAWNATPAIIDTERRLVIEASLLMKFLIMIARDGLAMRDAAGLAATLIELWHEDEMRAEEANG
jgi:hypothetical protein